MNFLGGCDILLFHLPTNSIIQSIDNIDMNITSISDYSDGFVMTSYFEISTYICI